MSRKVPGSGGAGRYRLIIVPLDGSRLSEQALPLAVALAERARAKLRLVLVHQLPTVPLSSEGRQLYVSLELETRKAEKAYLKTFAEQLKKQSGVAVTSRTLSGPVAANLREYIKESRTDLVVMTSRGQGGIRRLWLGSVADAVIRESSVPVLLVRPEENPSPRPVLENIRQIMVPLDGSALAEAILYPAKELAAVTGAELLLIQIIQTLAPAFEGPRPVPSTFDEDLRNLRRMEASDYLRKVTERCRQFGGKAVYSVTLGGNVANEILERAESLNVGMIAIATHGRGGLKRLALGSVADKLIRAAPCPVLVYRPPQGTRARDDRRKRR